MWRRINGDLIPDILVGAGIAGGSQVLALDGVTGAILTGFQAYQGPAESYNAPVRVAAIDQDNDGQADVLMTAQGFDGTTRLIRSFDLDGTYQHQFEESSADFCGAYFLADLVYGPANPVLQPSQVAMLAPPLIDVWTNPVNPRDVTSEGIVSPLDALQAINYINAHPGQTELPAQQTFPPRFYDVSEDGAITSWDVLLVVNHLNIPPSEAGEGEGSGAVDEIVTMMSSPLPSPVDLAAPALESATLEEHTEQVAVVEELASALSAERHWQLAPAHSPLVSEWSSPHLEVSELGELEAVLEDIASEIAALGLEG